MENDSGDFSLARTVEVIDLLESSVNAFRIHTRRSDIYPFDTVAGEILSKAFALARSAIILTQHGYSDEAFGLCRSLYECSINLRYITEKKSETHGRAAKFLEFGVTSKAFWFDLLDQRSDLTDLQREDLERYKAENGIPDDPGRMFKHWSGKSKMIERTSEAPHPADAVELKESTRIKDRAIAWTDTSTYVHCTQPGLNTYVFVVGEPILVRKARIGAERSSAYRVYMLIQLHLQAVVRYSLFGMEIITPEDARKQRYIK